MMHIPPPLRAVRALKTFASLAAALAFRPALTLAQSSDWTTVHQGASWYAAFVDQAISARDAVVMDGQWRRVGTGGAPQQLLLRGGLLRTIASGVRLGAGYAYVASAPYGELPAPAPTREHRTWQQLTLTHRAGAVTVVHRYRLEQRWLAALTTDATTNETDTGPWQYQNRVRYQARAQGNLPGISFRSRPLMGFAYDELLLPFGHGDPALRVTQNRLGAGVGVPLGARQRLDVGYMNLWNALPAQRANEINHTFTASWVWTATR